MNEQDAKSIKKAAYSELSHCIGYNNAIDQDRLLQAISGAILKAIEEYDRIRDSR